MFFMTPEIDEDDLEKLERAQRDLYLAEARTVLDQPHRRGSASQLRESALGRFIEDHECPQAWYEAAQDYAILTWKWRLARGIPCPLWVRQEFGGAGIEMNSADAAAFAAQIREWQEALCSCWAVMSQASPQGSDALSAMLFAGLEPQPRDVGHLKKALRALSIELGKG